MNKKLDHAARTASRFAKALQMDFFPILAPRKNQPTIVDLLS